MSYYGEDIVYCDYSEPTHYDDNLSHSLHYDNISHYDDAASYYDDATSYDETEPTYLDGYKDYRDSIEADEVYNHDEEAEPTHLDDATTWLPPPSPSLYGIEHARELEAYAEAASSRTPTWDEVHPAYRDDHPADDSNYSDSASINSSSEHWIQARPIQLLTHHVAEPQPPIDDGEYIDITDEYLEDVAQQMAAIQSRMAEWEAEDAAEEVLEDMEDEALDNPVISPDPDHTPPHSCYSDTTPPATVTNDDQVFSVQDRPLPVRHPPLHLNHSFPRNRPNRPTRLTHPTPPHSQAAQSHHAVKHRARLRNNRSTQTDYIPHPGPPTSQAKDPPQPFNLSSLRHVPPHLLQPTLDDAIRLVDHLSRRVSAERRIQKRTRTT
jgi:hypothetical protein